MINHRKGALSAAFFFCSCYTLCSSSVVKGCSLQLQPSEIKGFFCSLQSLFTVLIDLLHVIVTDILFNNYD